MIDIFLASFFTMLGFGMAVVLTSLVGVIVYCATDWFIYKFL